MKTELGQKQACTVCRENHAPDRGLSFDGKGINSCDMYRSRIATLQPDYLALGEPLAKRYNAYPGLVAALRDLSEAFPLHMMKVKDSDHFSRMVRHAQALTLLASLGEDGR